MTHAIRERLSVVEGGNLSVRHRIELPDGTTLKQADVETIQRAVYDASGAAPATEVELGAGGLDAVDAILDTPSTDLPWDRDTTGFTFQDDIDGRYIFTSGGQTLRVEYTIETNPDKVYGLQTITKFVDVRSRLTSA
jgi:hypothetical protein